MSRGASNTVEKPDLLGTESEPQNDNTFPEYIDLVRRTTLRRKIIRQIEQELFASRLGDCRHVLELGCGTGEITANLARRYEIVAIDVSEKLLGIARNKLNDVPVKFFKLNMFDLERLTIAFDAIIASRAFLQLKKSSLTQMLQLSASKLRPGGKIIFDVQRLNLARRAANRIDRRRRKNFSYHTDELVEIVSQVSGLKIVEMIYFDHYLALLPAAVLPGFLSGGRLARTMKYADLRLQHLPTSAGRVGVVCERL